MFGTRRHHGTQGSPHRRISTTHARYFNMAWDHPASDSALSDTMSPRKPSAHPFLSPYESSELPSLTSQTADLRSAAQASPLLTSGVPPLGIELGCNFRGTSDPKPGRSFLGSKIHRKLRNPTACDSIGYEVRRLRLLRTFLTSLPLLCLWCCLLLGLNSYLGYDRSGYAFANLFGLLGDGGRAAVCYAEGVLLLTAGVLYGQGYHNYYAARDAMLSVQHTATTSAYSFLKTLRDNRRSVSELQPLIYECLALLTAYPVAVTHKCRGNTCEPDVTRYCQDTALALHKLRDKSQPVSLNERRRGEHCGYSDHSNHGQFSTVDCFFEVFSLQLDVEFQQHRLGTGIPSQVPEHIMYNLRNHLENVVDWGNMHERRTPIVRENFDLLALSGRKCILSSRHDAQPVALIWTVVIAARMMALALPLQFGDVLRPVATVPGDKPPIVSFTTLCLHIVGFSILGSVIFTLAREIRGMWDPFGQGLNTYSWTLGTAMEIDDMLNEYYEVDENVIVRKQSYFCPAEDLSDDCSWSHGSASQRGMYSSSGKISEGTEDSEERPQTV